MNNWRICWFFIHLLNGELNPICHLLALLGGATIVVISRLRVKDFNSFLKSLMLSNFLILSGTLFCSLIPILTTFTEMELYCRIPHPSSVYLLCCNHE